MAESILLGHAPRPTSAAQLEKRIRTLVVAAEPAGIACTSIIDAALDGADVEHLHLDLTDFTLASEVDRDRARLEPQGAPVSSEDAVLRRLRVKADPMRISGAAVRLDAELSDVPFQWIETDNGELAVELSRPDAAHPLHGWARVAVPKEQLGKAVLGLAESALLDHGVTVTKLDIDVQAEGPRELRLGLDAKLRKGLIGGHVTGTARASIDDRMGVTLSDIALDSGNPLIAALLGAVRGRVAKLEGRRIDLASELPEGIRLADVQVEVTDDVTIEARLV
ncbi:hypothetical protein [Agrococcus carbonis]|uniref:DUF2993 domain-containing protein n=1 Tax=Agrococcus carbonis TaxID=684552 RepID=A0A1H1PQB2_9MICO|nr:hypothetical protein [Agrococcus carbonis]SDS13314.1 hypothetical protein SAMN04489719_1616 [Agrococcus carbonis]